MSTRKYYRNVTTVEFLSNEPWNSEAAESLETVNYEITDGDSIGYVTRTVANEELTREQAIAGDIRMGGDGSFIAGRLQMDEDARYGEPLPGTPGEPDVLDELVRAVARAGTAPRKTQGYIVTAEGRGIMTRSKRRRNRATLAVDLAELDLIITALVNDSGAQPQPDPGLLAYLSTKRENLRKRVSGTPITDEETS